MREEKERGRKRKQTDSEGDKQDGSKHPRVIPALIRNKIKRIQVYAEQRHKKKVEKKKKRIKVKKQAEQLGDQAPEKAVPRTLDNTREFDETVVVPEDQEVLEDEKTDEFSDYFNGKKPKILITTTVFPSTVCLTFVDQLLVIFPNSHYYKRGFFNLKQIMKFASNREFTDIMVANEDRKKTNGLLLIHLPNGPTAHFKLTSIVMPKDIPDHGKATPHRPEVILNNFTTRLGHSVGRMLAALFPHDPNFKGRRVATFHNQRDFIFFRHHRYIFDDPKKVRLQELGPRFCLKLRSLQKGVFDSVSGEYVWIYKPEMNTSRRRFHL